MISPRESAISEVFPNVKLSPRLFGHHKFLRVLEASI
jgi:hypothetical protein